MIETPRLVLRPLSADQAHAVVRRERAADWAPDYPAIGDVVGAQAYLHLVDAVGEVQPFGAWQIRWRVDGLVVGGIGFRGPPDPDGPVEVGYGVVPSVRRQGVATEALLGLLAWACRQDAVGEVRATADHTNVASQRVMASAGMSRVGEDEHKVHFRFACGGRTSPTAAVVTAAAPAERVVHSPT